MASGSGGVGEVGNGTFAVRGAVGSGGDAAFLQLFGDRHHGRRDDRQSLPMTSGMRTTITKNREDAEEDAGHENEDESEQPVVLVRGSKTEPVAAEPFLAVPVHLAPLLPLAAPRAHVSAAVDIRLVLVLRPVVAEEGVRLVGPHEERARDADGGDSLDAQQRRLQFLREQRRGRLLELLRCDGRVELHVDRVNVLHPGGDAHARGLDAEEGSQRRDYTFALPLLREGEGRLREVLQLQIEVEIGRGRRGGAMLCQQRQLTALRHEGVIAPALEIASAAATVAAALHEGCRVHREQTGTGVRAARAVEARIAHATLALEAVAVSVAHVPIDDRTVQPAGRHLQPRIAQTVCRLHAQRLLRAAPHEVGCTQLEAHQRHDCLALRDVARASERVCAQGIAGGWRHILDGASAENQRFVAVAHTHADHVVQDALQVRREHGGGHGKHGCGRGVAGARGACQDAGGENDGKVASEEGH